VPHRSAASLIAAPAACLILALAALLAVPRAAAAVQAVKVGDLDQPIYVTAPPGDSHRLFVVEKGGTIELLHGGVRKRFLDISAKVVANGEQGLLSMAFPRDYAISGRFYVYYTAPRGGDSTGSVLTIAEYRRSTADPDAADPGSERTLLRVDHPVNSNHNGGQLEFGPGGLLFAGTGDGGSGNDPPNNAQNPASRLGKLLRIDARNPGAVPELYALGLRNPWRFSFDRATGDLVIADVGQGSREEVDYVPRGTSAAGANYGWSCREGFAAGPRTCLGSFVDPVLDYDHGSGRCAITGGYVVRHHDLDSLFGRYVYVDLCGGDVRSLKLAAPLVTDDASTGLSAGGVYSFGEDSCGHLYMARGSAGEVDVLVDGAVTPCPEPKPPPEEPPPEPPPPDRKPPALTVKRKLRQHLEPHRSLYVTVGCSERCAITATARIPVPGRAKPFKVVRSLPSLRRDRLVRLRLLLTPVAARAVRAALRAGDEVTGRIRVVARDAARNQALKVRRVVVLR
jgi:hypothetical protein